MHEFVHAYTRQGGISRISKLERAGFPSRVRRFTIVDGFYAVMVTNVYASECNRPIRRDHVGYRLLDQTAFGLTLDPAFTRFFAALALHAPEFVAGLAAIGTEFNPCKRVSDLLDAQLYRGVDLFRQTDRPRFRIRVEGPSAGPRRTPAGRVDRSVRPVPAVA